MALKILEPSRAEDPEFRQRFIAESRAAARVDDPHIIPVYEADEAEVGTHGSGGVIWTSADGGQQWTFIDYSAAHAPNTGLPAGASAVSALAAFGGTVTGATEQCGAG